MKLNKNFRLFKSLTLTEVGNYVVTKHYYVVTNMLKNVV